MPYAQIHATASLLPNNNKSNHDLEQTLDTSHEWIVKRTGIHSRHIIGAQESTLTMAAACCQTLLSAAQQANLCITSVIVATMTAETVMPSIASQLCNRFGIQQAFAIDVNAACSGFIYALDLANSRIQKPREEGIIVIGVDAMSNIIDWQDRTTAILFGDGAGGVLLKKSQDPGIRAIECRANAQGADMLYTHKSPTGQQSVQMQGKEVFKHAVESLYQSTIDCLSEHQIPQDSIDWVVPHQANQRILEQVAKKLTISPERFIITLASHANTSAASIPLALDSAIGTGKIQRGQRILMQAFGAGFTCGVAIIDY